MTTTYRSGQDLTTIRSEVFQRAQEHGGPFRRSDLRRWTIDDGVLAPMLRRRWWVRLHHGVYVDARLLTGDSTSASRHLILCAASIRALPEPAFAFGSSAAAVHGLPIQEGLLSQVQLVRAIDSDGRALRRRIGSRDSLAPARIRTHRLPVGSTDIVNGIPTVSRALAAVTAAAMSSQDWAVATLDAAAWRNNASAAQMAAMADEWSHLGGIGTVRRALPHVRSGAQTPLESFSRLLLVQSGLPEPRLQVPLYDRAGLIGYVDMLWDEFRVVGEADGLIKYDSRNVLIREKEREDRIRSQGYSVVRWTWGQIFAAPDDVARRIRSARHGIRQAG